MSKDLDSPLTDLKDLEAKGVQSYRPGIPRDAISVADLEAASNDHKTGIIQGIWTDFTGQMSRLFCCILSVVVFLTIVYLYGRSVLS